MNARAGQDADGFVPHLLQLVDPGFGNTPLATQGPEYLRLAAGAWSVRCSRGQAFVFPSWRLAHRHAEHLLVHTTAVWMPVAAPDLTSSIPRAAAPCRGCGVADPASMPGCGMWAQPGLCQGCARSDLVESWTVYAHPADFPDRCVARRALNGIPTEDLLEAPTIGELRTHRPAGCTVIPRHSSDAGAIVELWLLAE